LPQRQTENELRCGSDRASAISTDAGAKPTPLTNVNLVGGAIKNKVESTPLSVAARKNYGLVFSLTEREIISLPIELH
jgi:hypothetical protein